MTALGRAALGAYDGRRAAPRSKPELVQRCRDLRTYCTRRRLVEPDELAAVWPERERKATIWDWFYCYAQLVRFLGREEERRPDAPAAEPEALAALRDEPVTVELPEGEVRVYPKSFEALLWFTDRDRLIAWLTDRRDRFHAAIEAGTLGPEGPPPAETLRRISCEISRQYGLALWQACQEGPGFREPPADLGIFETLDPRHSLRIYNAFVRVNVLRLPAVHAVARPRRRRGRKEPPVTWAVLFASAADRWRTDVRTLMRDRSLVSVLAQLELATPPDLDLEP